MPPIKKPKECKEVGNYLTIQASITPLVVNRDDSIMISIEFQNISDSIFEFDPIHVLSLVDVKLIGWYDVGGKLVLFKSPPFNQMTLHPQKKYLVQKKIAVTSSGHNEFNFRKDTNNLVIEYYYHYFDASAKKDKDKFPYCSSIKSNEMQIVVKP